MVLCGFIKDKLYSIRQIGVLPIIKVKVRFMKLKLVNLIHKWKDRKF